MEEGKPTATIRRVLAVFWVHTRRYLGVFVGALFCFFLATVADLVSPWFMKRFFDTLSQGIRTDAVLTNLGIAVALIFALDAFGVLADRIGGFLFNWYMPRVTSDLQLTTEEYLLGHSSTFFSDTFTGSLARRVQRIAQAYTSLFDEFLYSVWRMIITLLGTFIGMAFRSLALAFTFAGIVAVVIVLNYYATLWKSKVDTERNAVDSRFGGFLSDTLMNFQAVSLQNGASHELARTRSLLKEWIGLQVKSWNRAEIIAALQEAVIVIMNASLLWYAATLWVKGAISLGDIVLLQAYLMLALSTIRFISRSIRNSLEALNNAAETVALLDLPHEIRDSEGAKALVVKEGAITFDHVDFAYKDGRALLRSFTLRIRPGEKVGLVGPSGAGKSTVTKLLLRFFDAKKGSITVDGQDISRVTQQSLRKQIALIPQEPVLFHRSLKENIRYGSWRATDKEIIEAAKKARCHEFIKALPDGYDTLVGERGVKLSGGERQRIAIARAILRDTPILILDEATSSLDSESEQLIQEALHELMRDKTAIVIAHRLSTIMEMDRIVVMDQGSVVSTGTHEELLGKRGTYRRLWNIQAGGFTGSEIKKITAFPVTGGRFPSSS